MWCYWETADFCLMGESQEHNRVARLSMKREVVAGAPDDAGVFGDICGTKQAVQQSLADASKPPRIWQLVWSRCELVRVRGSIRVVATRLDRCLEATT